MPDPAAVSDPHGYEPMCKARDQYFRDLLNAGLEWDLRMSAAYARGFGDAWNSRAISERQQALEEAAKVCAKYTVRNHGNQCDNGIYWCSAPCDIASDIAAAIRSLAPDSGRGGE